MKNIKNIINNIKGMFSENLKGEEAEYALEVDGDINVINGNYLVNGVPVSGSGGGTLFGDVVGALTANSVNALQANPLDLSGITSGSVLTYDGINIIAEIKEAASSLESYRQVRVDPEYGDNLTGEVGNLGKPFQTISGALDAINNQLDPCVVLLPTNIEESVVIDMSQGVVAFVPFAGQTGWNAEPGVPNFTVAEGTSIQFYNINFSGNNEAVGVGTGTGNEVVFFLDCSLESNRDSTDLLVNFEKISCAYFNTQIASGTPVHTDCPTVIYTSPIFTDGVDDFVVQAPTESSFFVLLNCFINNATVSGNCSLLALPGSVVSQDITLSNLTDDSVVDFLGQCGNLIIDPKGAIILNGSNMNNLTINNSVDPIVISAVGTVVREQVNIGSNVNLIADGAVFDTNNVSTGIGAETSGWNRFNAGGGAANWYDPALGFIGSGQAGNISQPFPFLQKAIDAAQSNHTIHILPGTFAASVNATADPLHFKGPGNPRCFWNNDGVGCFYGENIYSFEDIVFNSNNGYCISVLNANLSTNNCQLDGNSIQAVDSQVSVRNSQLNGDVNFQQCTQMLFSDSKVFGTDVNVLNNGTIGSLSVVNSIINSNLNILSTVDVQIDKNSHITTINAGAWDDSIGTPQFTFHGSCQTIAIQPFNGADINLKGCRVGGLAKINSSPGTYSVNLNDAEIQELQVDENLSGPLTVSAINASIIGSITVGNNITLDLSGAKYDPTQITLVGTGTYIDNRTASVIAGDDIIVDTIIPGHFAVSASSLGGDLSGSIGNATVVKLQGNDLLVALPTSGSNLQFNGAEWVDTPQTIVQGEFYNCLYVDAVKGDDSTGERGNLNRPFATVQVAYDNALDGDLILLGGVHEESCYLSGGAENITIMGKGAGTLASVSSFEGSTVWFGDQGVPTLITDDINIKLQDIYLIGNEAPAATLICNTTRNVELKNMDFGSSGAPNETLSIVEGNFVHVDNMLCRGQSIIQANNADYFNGRTQLGGSLFEQQICPAGLGLHQFHSGKYGLINPIGAPTVTVFTSVSCLGFFGADLDETDGTPEIIFHGTAQAFISPAIGSFDLDGAKIFLSFQLQDAASSTFVSLLARSAQFFGSVVFHDQSVTPITCDLRFAEMHSTCSIGDEVGLDLSGAKYNPAIVNIAGTTGYYIDTLNERIMVTPIQDTTIVKPRDSLVLADNTIGTATVQLGPALTSCGEITIHAQESPAVNDVEIYSDGSDTIDGAASPYIMSTSHPRTVTFRADPVNGNWVIIATANV